MLRMVMGNLMTLTAVLALSACSASGTEGNEVGDGQGATGAGGGSGPGPGPGPGPGTGGGSVITFGGQMGGGPGPGPNGGAVRCDNKLTGVIRDFDPMTHKDFEPANPMLPGRTKQSVSEPGIVQATIGPDFKPLYAKDPATGSLTTYGQPWFDAWFRDTPGINMSTNYTIEFTDDCRPGLMNCANGDGVFTFDNGGKQFFPIDGAGLGNWQPYLAGLHNYHFTYELHAKFIYRRGMVFTFSGDDDVWVFVGGRLVVDIGGVHPKTTQGVNLDQLGLAPDTEHQLDFFWAERQVAQSNFRIDTSMEFTDCDLDIPR